MEESRLFKSHRPSREQIVLVVVENVCFQTLNTGQDLVDKMKEEDRFNPERKDWKDDSAGKCAS